MKSGQETVGSPQSDTGSGEVERLRVEYVFALRLVVDAMAGVTGGLAAAHAAASIREELTAMVARKEGRGRG